MAVRAGEDNADKNEMTRLKKIKRSLSIFLLAYVYF
jgi:hypothetical protein